MPEALAKEVLDFSESLKIKWQSSKAALELNDSLKKSFETGKSNSLRTFLKECPIGARTSTEIDVEFQSLRDEWETS
jgi:hypothetical protein